MPQFWECGSVVCRPRLGVFLWPGVWFSGVPSTFLVFLWPGGWFCGAPSTFLVVFVAGSAVLWCAVHVFGGFCGRECVSVVCRPRLGRFLWPRVWFCGVPSTFSGVFVAGSVVQWCAVHVFGGFCGRECVSVVCRPRLGRFLWLGVWFCGVPSTFLVVFVAGSVPIVLLGNGGSTSKHTKSRYMNPNMCQRALRLSQRNTSP